MTRSITRDVSAFARGLEELVGDIPESCSEEMEKAVAQSSRLGAKQLREKHTNGLGKHDWSEEYRQGFAARTSRDGLESVGEVGNRNKPGLVHLLEEGHLTLTGRRTQAYPHMDPAFQEMQDDFVERAEKAIGKALS